MSIREVGLAHFSEFTREQIRVGQADVLLAALAVNEAGTSAELLRSVGRRGLSAAGPTLRLRTMTSEKEHPCSLAADFWE